MAFKAYHEKPIRIFMIGDSTMANKQPSDAPETGWAQVFHELFTAKVEIQNHAKNGRSSKSFRDLGHWEIVERQLKVGDYVFIQFGHNDQKINDPARYAAPHSHYKENLIRYVSETQAKGAIPILLTPVCRRKFGEDGAFIDRHGDYPDVVREIVSELNIPLIDMHRSSVKLLIEKGEENSKKLFMHVQPGVYDKFPDGVVDNTHFNLFGAQQIAKLAAKDLVMIKHPLMQFLIE